MKEKQIFLEAVKWRNSLGVVESQAESDVTTPHPSTKPKYNMYLIFFSALPRVGLWQFFLSYTIVLFSHLLHNLQCSTSFVTPLCYVLFFTFINVHFLGLSASFSINFFHCYLLTLPYWGFGIMNFRWNEVYKRLFLKTLLLMKLFDFVFAMRDVQLLNGIDVSSAI